MHRLISLLLLFFSVVIISPGVAFEIHETFPTEDYQHDNGEDKAAGTDASNSEGSAKISPALMSTPDIDRLSTATAQQKAPEVLHTSSYAKRDGQRARKRRAELSHLDLLGDDSSHRPHLDAFRRSLAEHDEKARNSQRADALAAGNRENVRIIALPRGIEAVPKFSARRFSGVTVNPHGAESLGTTENKSYGISMYTSACFPQRMNAENKRRRRWYSGVNS